MANVPTPEPRDQLADLLSELRAYEPIFHRPAFGKNVADFERRMAPDYWEVGASGRSYDRACILKHLAQHPPVDADEEGWLCSDFGIRRLGEDCFLLTYKLDQNPRITLRSTIWERTEAGWRIRYHQGTIVPPRT